MYNVFVCLWYDKCLYTLLPYHVDNDNDDDDDNDDRDHDNEDDGGGDCDDEKKDDM